MTPEEKAAELIDKFSKINRWVGGEGFISLGIGVAKRCAIVCVTQILSAMNDRLDDTCEAMVTEYWMQVLEHIKQQ